MVVSSGAIYSHVELRRNLEGAGIRTRIDSDTEAMLELIEAHGRRAWPLLDGMSVFAICDATRRSVVHYREPFGVEPLANQIDSDGIACATEPIPAVAHVIGRLRRETATQ